MSAKSSIAVLAVVGAIIAPLSCLAQGGGGSGAGGAGGEPSGGAARSGGPANSGTAVGTGAPGPAGPPTSGGVTVTAPAARPVLPPAPAQNSNMTWDGDRLRPNDYRIAHPIYPRPRTALTPFDVNPFRAPQAPYAYGVANYEYGGCYLVRQRVMTQYGWRVQRFEVCG